VSANHKFTVYNLNIVAESAAVIAVKSVKSVALLLYPSVVLVNRTNA
jgi:hypothetical protein